MRTTVGVALRRGARRAMGRVLPTLEVALILAALLVALNPGIVGGSNSYTVSVATDKLLYSGSQTIQVSGSVSPAPQGGTSVFIRIMNPQGTIVWVNSTSVERPVTTTPSTSQSEDSHASPMSAPGAAPAITTTTASSAGFFFDSFPAGGSNWIFGLYTVNATWGPSASGPVYFGVTHFTYGPAGGGGGGGGGGGAPATTTTTTVLTSSSATAHATSTVAASTTTTTSQGSTAISSTGTSGPVQNITMTRTTPLVTSTSTTTSTSLPTTSTTSITSNSTSSSTVAVTVPSSTTSVTAVGPGPSENLLLGMGFAAAIIVIIIIILLLRPKK